MGGTSAQNIHKFHVRIKRSPSRIKISVDSRDKFYFGPGVIFVPKPIKRRAFMYMSSANIMLVWFFFFFKEKTALSDPVFTPRFPGPFVHQCVIAVPFDPPSRNSKHY